MAYLKSNAELRNVENLLKEYFTSEEGRDLLKVYEIENGQFILVEELQSSDLCYTFFEKQTSRRIAFQECYQIQKLMSH